MDPQTQELHDRLMTVAHALIVAPFIAFATILLVVGLAYVFIALEGRGRR